MRGFRGQSRAALGELGWGRAGLGGRPESRLGLWERGRGLARRPFRVASRDGKGGRPGREKAFPGSGALRAASAGRARRGVSCWPLTSPAGYRSPSAPGGGPGSGVAGARRRLRPGGCSVRAGGGSLRRVLCGFLVWTMELVLSPGGAPASRPLGGDGPPRADAVSPAAPPVCRDEWRRRVCSHVWDQAPEWARGRFLPRFHWLLWAQSQDSCVSLLHDVP